MYRFFPFLTWFKAVNNGTLRADFIAGITGAIVVLPQGVAFAIIAGMPPIYGLYTAMVLPVVAALFGSSHHLISGPTTAISIVVFSTVSQFASPSTPEFVTLAIGVTFIAGAIQLTLGLVRFGVIVNFVSHSVVIGFTAGAALLIATSQLKHFFGLDIARGTTFLDTWWRLIWQITETNPYVLGISIFTLVVALLIRRIHRLVPHMLVAMIFGSVLAYFLGGETVGISVVGELPKGLPPVSWPLLDFGMMQRLAPNAFAIAMLGLIEAVAIARSVATKTGQRIDGNQEFIGQGLSNLVGSFFSCYAGSGSFTRSGVNYSSGAKTPMAAIFAAILLMLVVSFVAPLAAYLPIPAMAGIIVLVAYNLVDFHHIKKIVRTSKRESTVLFITLIATLVLELEYAIYLGVFFSLVFYLQRTAQPRFVRLAPDPSHKYRMFLNVEKEKLPVCPQLMIVRIEGSLYFGAIEHVKQQLDELYDQPHSHYLVISNGINLIDTSSAEMLVDVVKSWEAKGKFIYFSGLKLRARESMQDGGYWDEIGADRFFISKEEAVHALFGMLDQNKCNTCPVKVFRECSTTM
ncbi:MAG: SulP family inorganic anion transporter [Cyclobacteriaceae bacterium]|nr:SulP family inorganic anion transporter [Cyclobacteriaceae bacterium]